MSRNNNKMTFGGFILYYALPTLGFVLPLLVFLSHKVYISFSK